MTGSVEELDAIGSAAQFLLIAHVSKSPREGKSEIIQQTGPRGLVALAKDHVDRELANPDLSLELVATRIGVSVRYLHKVFSTEETTFGHYVRNQRLDRIRADLLDPHYQDMAISEVAARWGMNDATTLYRNFKGRYGDTPGQVRLLVRAVQRVSSPAPSRPVRTIM